MLSLAMSIHSIITQTARLARDMWNSTNLNDVWERELRKWEDII
jgi:hypothetical protein